MERHLDEFKGSSLDNLICHGLKALNSTLPNEVTLNTKNCSLAIVGKDMKFTIFEDDNIDSYLKLFEATQASTQASTTSDSGPTPMEQDQPAS
ncbi:unnamed protein product [Trichobilharzia regenti]|nr:unnamed protein product [Trichobilharzia regenti]